MENKAIRIARTELMQNIWRMSCIDGRSIQSSTIEAFFDNKPVTMNYEEFTFLNNLRRAWEFCFNVENNKNSDIRNMKLSCMPKIALNINAILCNAATSNSSELYNGKAFSAVAEEIRQVDPTTSIDTLAVGICMLILNHRLFIRCNTITALMTANMMLLANGIGIIDITYDEFPIFKNLLRNFRDDSNKKDLYDFLIKHIN